LGNRSDGANGGFRGVNRHAPTPRVLTFVFSGAPFVFNTLNFGGFATAQDMKNQKGRVSGLLSALYLHG
jgi:hypothetical protein